jgi:recombination protein RecT
MGDKPFVSHKPGDDDTSPFVKVYAIGRINGAQWPVVEVWSRNKVQAHLRQYNKVGDRHYALQNENNLEMYARKIALLQVIKYMPKSIEIRQAQELEYRAADGLQNLTISNSGILDAEFTDISGVHDAIDQSATKTEAVKAVIQKRAAAANGKKQDQAPVQQTVEAQPAQEAQQAELAQKQQNAQEQDVQNFEYPEADGEKPNLW